MSNPPEEFEQLRKLLQLKRYEQPPPRFFNEFSARVMAGIAEEESRSTSDRLLTGASGLARFFQMLERNALVAGGFVTGVCALLIGGIVYSEYVDSASGSDAPSPTLASVQSDAPAFRFADRGSSSSLDPVFASSNSLPGDTLFGQASFKQVNWTIPQ